MQSLCFSYTAFSVLERGIFVCIFVFISIRCSVGVAQGSPKRFSGLKGSIQVWNIKI